MTGSTLRYGSSGPDVVRWQNVIGVTPDGKFGPMTLSATKEWQKSHGLTADGVVGPLTWGSVPNTTPTPQEVSQVSPIYTPASAPAPAPIPTVTTRQAAVPLISPTVSPVTGSRPTLRYGAKGNYVAEWQRIVGATPDGMFGSSTLTMTKAFQKKNGLTADGVVGPKTWDVGLMLQRMSNRASLPPPPSRNTAPARRAPILGRRTPAKVKPKKKPSKLKLKDENGDVKWGRVAAVGTACAAGIGVTGWLLALAAKKMF